MSKFFNFYDPLEKRYVFNSFLVIVALVEVLILIFTLIWKIDFDGIFLEQARPPVPFPWKEYLLATVTAPIILLFLFGVVVRGFELMAPEGASPAGDQAGLAPGRKRKGRCFWWLGLVSGGVLLLLAGVFAFPHLAAAIKTLGLGGTYLLIALVALAALYFPLRLLLRYRLQKKAMEYQYLLTLAERHGVFLVDRPLPPGLRPAGEGKKIISPRSPSLPAPEKTPEEPESN